MCKMKKQLINLKQAINRSNNTGDLGAIMRLINKFSTHKSNDHEYFELDMDDKPRMHVRQSLNKRLMA